eukprot:1857740-Rhodomonas_salina.1
MQYAVLTKIWCYAMCGPDGTYGAMQCAVLTELLTEIWCYAMCGTDGDMVLWAEGDRPAANSRTVREANGVLSQ